MSRRGSLVACALALVLAVVAAAGQARADSPAAANSAGVVAAHAGVKLRHWFIGFQGVAGERDRWDVFNRADLPPAAVADRGRGSGMSAGYRFGDRFLLGLQLVATGHDLQDVPEKLYDAEALITGTVLFHERGRLQPFLRGGLGGAAVVLESPGGTGHTVSLGTAAVGGGGLQVRLGSRFSLEAEAVVTFSNLLEVHENLDDGSGTDWRVKTSQVGWRSGVGLAVWF